MEGTRKPRGRKKIEIKRIKKEDARQITFSKRKGGVFKKAHELATLCGAEIAVIVFSPAGKPFSFISHESLIDRYLRDFLQDPMTFVMPRQEALDKLGAERKRGVALRKKKEATIRELNKEYSEALDKLEAERKRGVALRKKKEAYAKQFWWDPIDNLGVHELELLSGAITDLKLKVAERAHEVLLSSPSYLPGNYSGMSSTSHGERSSATTFQNHQITHTSFLHHHGYGVGFSLGGGNGLN